MSSTSSFISCVSSEEKKVLFLGEIGGASSVTQRVELQAQEFFKISQASFLACSLKLCAFARWATHYRLARSSWRMS